MGLIKMVNMMRKLACKIVIHDSLIHSFSQPAPFASLLQGSAGTNPSVGL